jgi:hypothetical protein
MESVHFLSNWIDEQPYVGVRCEDEGHFHMLGQEIHFYVK